MKSHQFNRPGRENRWSRERRIAIMIKLLQINLRKNGYTRNMIDQTARNLRSDILILSEMPRGLLGSSRYAMSSDKKSAVALSPTVVLAPTGSSRGPGFACMTLPGLLVYSCYLRPGCLVTEFE